MQNVAIYCRVSTTEQTLGQQEKVLTDYCKEREWNYKVFSEKVSGSKQSRTVLNDMLERVRKKEFNAVAVAKLDRLGRSLKHLIQLIEEFNNRNIQFICLNPQVDTTTAQGRFFIQIIGAVAELEREMIRERTREKLSYLKKKGIKLGRPTGSKDKKARRKSGYYMRHIKK